VAWCPLRPSNLTWISRIGIETRRDDTPAVGPKGAKRHRGSGRQADPAASPFAPWEPKPEGKVKQSARGHLVEAPRGSAHGDEAETEPKSFCTPYPVRPAFLVPVLGTRGLGTRSSARLAVGHSTRILGPEGVSARLILRSGGLASRMGLDGGWMGFEGGLSDCSIDPVPAPKAAPDLRCDGANKREVGKPEASRRTLLPDVSLSSHAARRPVRAQTARSPALRPRVARPNRLLRRTLFSSRLPPAGHRPAQLVPRLCGPARAPSSSRKREIPPREIARCNLVPPFPLPGTGFFFCRRPRGNAARSRDVVASSGGPLAIPSPRASPRPRTSPSPLAPGL